MTKETETKSDKVLGGSSYKNSKQKKKIQKQKAVETKKVVTKDRQIKVKIRHLEKELERISKAQEENKIDAANSTKEKKVINEKISKLETLNKKFTKK